MNDRQRPEPSEEMKNFALYVAIVIRNAMEEFHQKHLSDEQMKQLNPIIRNAICTAIYAFENYEQTTQDMEFVNAQLGRIPDYWESPQLLDDYLQLWDVDE